MRGWVLLVLLLTLNGCGSASSLSRQGSRAPARQAAERPANGSRVECGYIKRSCPDGTQFRAGGYEASAAGLAGDTACGVFVAHMGEAGEAQWTRHFASRGGASIQDLVVRDDGGAFVTGWSVGSLASDTRALLPPTAPGQVECFLFSLGKRGHCRWMAATRVKGKDAYASGEVVVGLLAGGCIVAGNVSGRALFGEGEPNESVIVAASHAYGFLARYDECGHLLWVRKLAGLVDAERGAAVCASSGGTILVAGQAVGGRGVFISCHATDGSPLWVRTAKGTGSVACEGGVLAADGSVAVTGWFRGHVDFHATSGESGIRTDGSVDLFVASYSTAGRLRWIRTVGGEGEASAVGQRVSTRADGTLAVEGAFSGRVALGQRTSPRFELAAVGDEDLLLATFDPNGQPLSLGRSSRESR